MMITRDEFLSKISDMKYDKFKSSKVGAKCSYPNIACAFDTETSSFVDSNGDKAAIMYEWTFGIDEYITYGRTWSEFLELINSVCNTFMIDLGNRLVVYVHNLSFEFQFMRKLFKWDNVFCVSSRKPIKALTTSGVEFRCSQALSGYSLEKLGENLVMFPVKKMVGDLDYSLIRHSETTLTEKELGYCENDVRIILNYIKELLCTGEKISTIPLTKTGYVRRICRKNCYSKESKGKYALTMKMLTIGKYEYAQLKRAAIGGFVHSNPFHTNKVIHNVSSFDITSSYPAVLCSEKFPMSRCKYVVIDSDDKFNFYINNYCCLFDVVFNNLKSKDGVFDYPIPESKTKYKENCFSYAGRIVDADVVCTTINEQDFSIIKDCYTWSGMSVSCFRIYEKGYLPKEIISSVLELYNAKTALKGIPGKEVEYSKSKEALNSVFGMMITDPIRTTYNYAETDWDDDVVNSESDIDAYNENKNRFTFYPWGVWCLSYARRNLFNIINQLGSDYIYSDTDSVKFKNAANHIKAIGAYNVTICNKIKCALEHLGIDTELSRPCNADGEIKPLGIWENDNNYEMFRTMGAKRYMYSNNGKLSITISGVNKNSVPEYLTSVYGSADNAINAFEEGVEFPAEVSGRKEHTLFDYEIKGEIEDYTGLTAPYHEMSGVNIENTSYSIGEAYKIVSFIRGITDKIQ